MGEALDQALQKPPSLPRVVIRKVSHGAAFRNPEHSLLLCHSLLEEGAPARGGGPEDQTKLEQHA